MISPAKLLSRAFAWFRRNPAARADTLELAATTWRGEAVRRDADGRTKAAARARRRADLLDARVAQLRKAAG